jgi:hypothetical protein
MADIERQLSLGDVESFLFTMMDMWRRSMTGGNHELEEGVSPARIGARQFEDVSIAQDRKSCPFFGGNMFDGTNRHRVSSQFFSHVLERLSD